MLRHSSSFLPFLLLTLFISATALGQAGTSTKIVSSRPEATVTSKGERKEAQVALPIASGDKLETGPHGKLSLLLPDHMLLKVAELTQFIYNGIGPSGINGKLLAGKVWLRGQKRETDFKIDTPTATAAIRGTEWYMEVAPDGSTTVGVIDGAVEVSNSLGSIELASREIALVEQGKPPRKLAHLAPENAVNWTLNYFGLWSEQDYKRAPPALESAIREMVRLYYESDLKAAEQALLKEKQFGTNASY
ncbi:MAG: FecR domain-containing protein, partial [Deltaproteobacteria bacterium]|nr:FecR domain-containing protein [Deltaproteobacteria bacterium]